MRIALLTNEYPPYPGGVATYTREIALAAHALGHDVTVVAPDYGRRDLLDDDPITIVRIADNHFKTWPHTLWKLVRQVRRVLREGLFDVVHATDWPMVLALGYMARRGEMRIATIHGSDVLTLHRARRNRLVGSRRATRSFDRYVPNSRFSAALLTCHFPTIAEDRIRVVPLGVGESWMAAVPDSGLANDAARPFTILTVARIEDRKGHLAMVEAIGLLPRSVVPPHYVCIGKKVDEPLFAAIEKRAAELGVDFIYRGVVTHDELVAAYRSADLFFLAAKDTASDVEGFGLVLIEAASQGLPALVTPVHAIPEVVRDGVTGWIAADTTPATISAKLAEILADRGAVAARCDDCIAHARTFTWLNTARQTYAP